MGIFYNKLVESVSADVEDAIQTPDDIGVDLDAIEKAVAGNDGIEAHRDEIEAAEEGTVGNPIDECSVIMYESEYNFNQLMKCIGVNELHEYAAGRDFILEGANLNAFIENIRKIFTGMFTKFTELYNKAVNWFSREFNFDKKFVREHDSEIKAGFNRFQDWLFEDFYDMDKLNIECKLKDPDQMLEIWDHAVDAVMSASSSNLDINNGTYVVIDKKQLSNSAAVKRVCDLDVSDDNAASEMVEKLKEKAFVKVERYHASSGSKLLSDVLTILGSQDDVKKLRDGYNRIKNEYSKFFKWLKECQKTFKNDNEVNFKNIKATCVAYSKAAQYEKNLQHSYFSVCLSAYKTRRNQARRMALTWQRLGVSKPKVQHNSATININII